jgi:flagellar hook assembly protein FlgD
LAALRVGPGPSRTGVDIELVNPAGPALRASVTVSDLAGRKMATLLDGATAPGPTTLRWDGRDLAGRPVAAGIYHVRAEIAGVRLTRRIALVR